MDSISVENSAYVLESGSRDAKNLFFMRNKIPIEHFQDAEREVEVCVLYLQITAPLPIFHVQSSPVEKLYHNLAACDDFILR